MFQVFLNWVFSSINIPSESATWPLSGHPGQTRDTWHQCVLPGMQLSGRRYNFPWTLFTRITQSVDDSTSPYVSYPKHTLNWPGNMSSQNWRNNSDSVLDQVSQAIALLQFLMCLMRQPQVISGHLTQPMSFWQSSFDTRSVIIAPPPYEQQSWLSRAPLARQRRYPSTPYKNPEKTFKR